MLKNWYNMMQFTNSVPFIKNMEISVLSDLLFKKSSNEKLHFFHFLYLFFNILTVG